MALNSYVVHNIGENGKWTGALQTYCTHKKKVSFFPLCTAVLSFFLVRVHHRAFFSTRSMVLFIYSHLVFTVLYIHGRVASSGVEKKALLARNSYYRKGLKQGSCYCFFGLPPTDRRPTIPPSISG